MSSSGTAIIILLGTVVGIGVVIFVVATVLNIQKNRRQRFLKVIQGRHENKSGKDKKIITQDQRRAEIAKKLKETGEQEKAKEGSVLPQLIMQTGMNITVKQYWIGSAIFAFIATFIAVISGQSAFMTILIAIISFMGIPRLFLKMKAKSRQKKFLDDFADALDSMGRLLKSGMPVSEAVKMVAREFTGPVGEEMSRVYDEQKVGISLPDAILNSAKRMPLPEMQMFATAVAIQAQTGSSLSEVLVNLSNMIRARFRLKRKIDALSSEAKASAMIIGALPCLVAGGMYLINPDYIEVLFITSKGNFVLGAAVFWMFIGIIVMRQMINFKV